MLTFIGGGEGYGLLQKWEEVSEKALPEWLWRETMVRGLNKDPAEVKEVGEAVKHNFAVTPLDCLILNDVPKINGLLCTVHFTARKSFSFT